MQVHRVSGARSPQAPEVYRSRFGEAHLVVVHATKHVGCFQRARGLADCKREAIGADVKLMALGYAETCALNSESAGEQRISIETETV
jgi:hypothetical protein